MAERYNEVANRLTSTRSDASNPSVDHIVTGADEVYDDVAPYRTNGHIDCTAVTPVGTENPVELRWYERVNYGTEQEPLYDWIRSQDTTVDNQKTYGIPNGAKQSDINNQLYKMAGDIDKVVLYANEYEQITSYPSGANPQANGWYTESGGVYTQTTDTTVVEAHKPYYARVAHISPDENNIVNQQDGYIPTAGAVGRALGANFEDNLTSTSAVKGLTANQGRVLNEKKADKNGWYEQFVAGASLSVIGDDIDDKAKFFYRETGDSEDTGGTKHTIEKGTATFNKIRGNTVKFNQLVHTSTSTSSTTINGVTFTNNGDGSYTVNGTASAITYFQLEYRITSLSNHIGYIKGCPEGGSVGTYCIGDGLWADWYETGSGLIRTFGGTGTSIRIRVNSGATVTNKVFRPQVFDLTAMGIDTLTTTAEVEAWLTQNVGYQDYYPYNAGSLISLKPKKLISTGFNQWDKTYSVANSFLNYDGTISSNNSYGITNYIKVLPSTYYYINKASGTSPAVCFYDANKNYISGIKHNHGGTEDSLLIQTPDNCVYLRESVVYTSADSVIINISDDKDGTYIPYMKSEVDLSWIMDIPDPTDNTKKLFPYGLLQAVNNRDEIAANKAIKRINAVDLGSLTWIKDITNHGFYSQNLNSSQTPNGEGRGKIDCLCIRYKSTAYDAQDDKSIWFGYYYNNGLQVRDTAFDNNTAAEYKEAMSGVMLYYTFRDQVEVTFDELNTHPMNYEVEPGGIEEFVKADAALGENEPTSTSLTATITYPMDTLQTIRNLETNLATLKSNYRTTIGNLASTLSTALGGTFTATESTEGSGLYTFSYAAPASGFLAAGNGANGTWSVDNNTMLLTPVSNSNSSENESI